MVYLVLIKKGEERPRDTERGSQTHFDVTFDLKHLYLSSEIPFSGPIVSLSVYITTKKPSLPAISYYILFGKSKIFLSKQKQQHQIGVVRRFPFVHFRQIPFDFSLFTIFVCLFCFIFSWLKRFTETSFSFRLIHIFVYHNSFPPLQFLLFCTFVIVIFACVSVRMDIFMVRVFIFTSLVINVHMLMYTSFFIHTYIHHT